MRAYERLLKYVKIHTTSDEDSTTVPSTSRQFDLARLLVDELHDLGVMNAKVDDKCYVYASIAATAGCENKRSIGFIAHMDTAPDFSGENVNPIVEENYDGEDVILGTSGRIIKVADFPHLKSLKGRTLIHTDGTTLLGADDKSGVAEIMTFMEELLSSGEPHGKICIAFTPDEEIGAGADHFDVEYFGADFAYTVDGGAENAVEYENFNAASAQVKFNGVNIQSNELFKESSKKTSKNNTINKNNYNYIKRSKINLLKKQYIQTEISKESISSNNSKPTTPLFIYNNLNKNIPKRIHNIKKINISNDIGIKYPKIKQHIKSKKYMVITESEKNMKNENDINYINKLNRRTCSSNKQNIKTKIKNTIDNIFVELSKNNEENQDILDKFNNLIKDVKNIQKVIKHKKASIFKK